MQIPASPPDLSVPLIARRELQPVTPVTAVPGISELAEHLDPRVALQWAQPVFKGQLIDPTRSAIEEAIQPQPGKAANQSGSTPTISTQPSIEWSTATPGLQTLLTRAGTSVIPQSWPTRSNTPDPSTSNANPGLGVIKQLESTYQSLKSSNLFAAQHLAETLLPKSGVVPESTPQLLQHMQQWIACLDPESQTAQQAANMLMTGQMVWQGEIYPGNAVRMQREDAWKESPTHPGQIEKGASLVVDITLPHLGQLKICGYKWADQMDLAIQFTPSGKQALMDARSKLEAQLQAVHTEKLRTHWLEKS
jgi:hypothetical protein